MPTLTLTLPWISNYLLTCKTTTANSLNLKQSIIFFFFFFSFLPSYLRSFRQFLPRKRKKIFHIYTQTGAPGQSRNDSPKQIRCHQPVDHYQRLVRNHGDYSVPTIRVTSQKAIRKSTNINCNYRFPPFPRDRPTTPTPFINGTTLKDNNNGWSNSVKAVQNFVIGGNQPNLDIIAISFEHKCFSEARNRVPPSLPPSLPLSFSFSPLLQPPLTLHPHHHHHHHRC